MGGAVSEQEGGSSSKAFSTTSSSDSEETLQVSSPFSLSSSSTVSEDGSEPETHELNVEHSSYHHQQPTFPFHLLSGCSMAGRNVGSVLRSRLITSVDVKGGGVVEGT
jgi:hypothetical protein